MSLKPICSDTAIIPDVRQDWRIGASLHADGFVRTLVVVPVRQDDPIGSLGAYWTQARQIGEEDVVALQAVADAAALAIASIQLERASNAAQLAARETAHRLRNLMQVVAGLVDSLGRSTPDLATFKFALHARLVAMSRALNRVSGESSESTTIEALLQEQVMAEPARLTVQGPAMRIGSDDAFVLGLTFYELATNAVKYGALSSPEGSVAVTWSEDAATGEAQLWWRESGGPPVAKPEGSGFGTRLIRRLLRSRGGAVELRFKPEGFTCHLVWLGLAKERSAASHAGDHDHPAPPTA